MSDKATREAEAAPSQAQATPLRWVLPGFAVLILALFTYVGASAAPYFFNGMTIVSEIAGQLRETTGLELTTEVGGRFDLLPRPHIVLLKLHVADPSGTLSIDGDGLDGEVRLLPLIVGRIELSSATITKPHLVIDLDGAPMQPDSLIGRAMRAAEPFHPERGQRLGAVTFEDGTAVLKSHAFGHAPDFSAINVTLDWRDLDSPGTLTGSLAMHGTSADVAAWVAQPAALMRGDHSAMAVRIHSAPIDLSTSGDLVSGATTGFRGHVTTSSPSGTGLLAFFGSDAPMIAPFANVLLDSDAVVALDPKAQTTIDLPNLKLRADGNDFEGTLAFQTGDRPTLSGTLATEQLALAPFLHRLPPLYGAGRRWSAEPILGREPQPLDLDLRVSATHMRLAPVGIDDVALSVMTRGTRTEVALVEGKAYGGVAKARLSVGVADDGISLRGTGSLTGADAATLSWDTLGRQVVAGTMTTAVSVEAKGDSPASLMADLHGSAKGTLRDGELSGIDFGHGLRDMQTRKVVVPGSVLNGGRTVFSSLTFDARIAGGVATLEEGTATGPEAAVALSGSADIAARRLDLHAAATPPGSAGAATPHLALDLGGSFDRPQMAAPKTDVAPGP